MYNGTIMRQYITRNANFWTRENWYNNTLLKEIILSHTLDRYPRDDEIVIHLRAGDWSSHEINFTKSINQILQNNTIRLCTIVTLIQFGNYFERGKFIPSEQKIEEAKEDVKRIIRKIVSKFPFLQFDVRSNVNVDDDFAYMIRSKHFIKSVGGLSFFIEVLRNISI